jgi:hypothetical protein
MFKNPTVFILGAGASWHYGYPTGEELVKKIIEKARYASLYFDYSIKTSNAHVPQYIKDRRKVGLVEDQWREACTECEQFREALEQVNPLVIDYFLGWNPRFQGIGTLLIAWVILECEQIRLQRRGNVNRLRMLEDSPFPSERVIATDRFDIRKFKDDWCRFLIHNLAIECKTSSDLLRNDVRFITFNYDVSLEAELLRGLRHIELFQKSDIDEFFAQDRIMHVYGKVRQVPPTDPPHLNWDEQSRDPIPTEPSMQSKYASDRQAFFDVIYAASRGLRVIDPFDKATDENVIKAAQNVLARAHRVYILGYGFDENNSKRLGLQQTLRYDQNNKSVFFTSFRDINRVNKAASRVFFGNARHFISGNPAVEDSSNYYYEKSVRDVYEALELDFESLEEGWLGSNDSKTFVDPA